MSEILHLICAHCGADNTVSNRLESDGTLVLHVQVSTNYRLRFCCQACKAEYLLPVEIRETYNTNLGQPSLVLQEFLDTFKREK